MLHPHEELRDFLIKNAPSLKYWEGGTAHLVFPQFRLYPRDYLTAAEAELNETLRASSNKQRLIHRDNCIHQLKHATESAVDVFLAAYGLYDRAVQKKLHLPAKLTFLDDAGVAPTRSLRRLNWIRNKIEHEHSDVETADLELYLDVVSTFVALLQAVTALAAEEEATFLIVDPRGVPLEGGVCFDYRRDSPEIVFSWSQTDWPSATHYPNLSVGPEKPQEFALAFKIMLLLLQLEHVVSGEYVGQLLGSTGA